jgi:hypothetical protein
MRGLVLTMIARFGAPLFDIVNIAPPRDRKKRSRRQLFLLVFLGPRI